MNIDSFRQTPIGGSTPLKRKYAMEEDFLEISGVPGSDSLIDSSNDGISESSRVVTPFSVLRYHEPVSVDVVDGNKRSERLARNSRSTPSWLDFHEKLASRRAWTDEEDKKLRELTRNLSDQHNRWAVIADSMFGRTCLVVLPWLSLFCWYHISYRVVHWRTWCSSIVSYNITSTNHNQHTNIH